MYKGQLEELSAGGNLSRSAFNQNAFITVPFKKTLRLLFSCFTQVTAE